MLSFLSLPFVKRQSAPIVGARNVLPTVAPAAVGDLRYVSWISEAGKKMWVEHDPIFNQNHESAQIRLMELLHWTDFEEQTLQAHPDASLFEYRDWYLYKLTLEDRMQLCIMIRKIDVFNDDGIPWAVGLAEPIARSLGIEIPRAAIVDLRVICEFQQYQGQVLYKAMRQ